MIVMMAAREPAAKHVMGIQSSSKLFVKGLSIFSRPPSLRGDPNQHWKANGEPLSSLENLTDSWAPLAARGPEFCGTRVPSHCCPVEK